MDAFEDEGDFWLAGNEGERRAGRVKFDPVRGATLRLIGGFGDLAQQFNASGDIVRIHGAVGKRHLTLDNCFSMHTGYETLGSTRQTYYIGRIIAGYLFGADEDLAFDGCSVAFDHLATWVNRSGITRPRQLGSPDHFVVEFRQPEDEYVQFGDDELGLASTWSVGGDHITETSINQGTYLKLKYPDARGLNLVLDDVRHIQDLVTLANTAVSVPIEIILWRDDIEMEYSYRPRPLTFYAAQLADRVRMDDPQPARVLFKYQDIGGLPTIARWLEVARQYRIVVASLLSIRYSGGLYAENRFNNVISAAESFHRLRFPDGVKSQAEFEQLVQALVEAAPKEHQKWLGKQLQFANEPRLWQRLNQMTKHAGAAFTALYEKPGTWVEVVTQSRNRLVHHDKDQPVEFQPGDLHFLAESVFLLVMLCLLRECDIDDKAFAAIAKSSSVKFLRAKLTELVPRLHEQMKRK